MKSKYLSLLIALFIAANAYTQNIFPSTGSAGIGTTTPNASSILDMVSTTKGILIPRMTIAQRKAMVPPVATGLLIYQTNSLPGFYYYTGTVWQAITPKAGWLLTGNAGTDPATNFIGTTDAQPLVFKVNNQKAGYLGSSTTNTAFGYQALNVTNNLGLNNTAYGFQALYNNTEGESNLANGVNALYANTAGSFNTANGYWALKSNTYGYSNTATGAFALYFNSDGTGNTANGISTLHFNTHGSENTADGANALFSNTTGYSNVAIGTHALYNNSSVNNLVAVGDSALYNQSGGSGYNTAVGSKALYSNITGYGNTAIGYQTLYSNTVGNGNTATGLFALTVNDGAGNTAFGGYALSRNLSGIYNTGLGTQTLYHNLNGSGNTAVGVLSDVNSDGYSSSSAFGYNSIITASDQVRIGNTSTASIGGYQSWTTLPSDKRVKKNIKENVPGLAFINKLKPVTYNLDLNAVDNIIQRPVTKDKDGKTIQPSQQESDSRKAKEQIVFTGFVAQDVAAAASSIHYDFSGVDIPKNDKDIYGLRYSDFVMPLVKAVQELSKKNDELQKQIDDLKAMVVSGNQKSIIACPSGASVSSLTQNVPNPFSKVTTINYSLPQKYLSAKIIVIDESGNTIKIFNLSGTGKGSINFSSPFRVGASYQYSLLVDGKLIDTKQMELIK